MRSAITWRHRTTASSKRGSVEMRFAARCSPCPQLPRNLRSAIRPTSLQPLIWSPFPRGNSLIKESHGISRRAEEEGGVDDERGKDSVMKHKETAEVDASGDKSKRQAP